ncbi:transglutaminase-like cysteine peptidase [Mesorhizobium sp. LHD-90]|uniref:transglutaminase-like cysteine peptidase n=1 Tax=Mesorhizobium sp. LHD-90 TaxID=3071414 RepID=UPI0027DEF110|nr:transglutaminase-like cysteine peptidase [Mesorhizobium sp. LHD-90]MDQ6437920.1 transglutaminase-like cysteine peptidase [Mesorhizobium sp. LHD-90]
MTKAKGMSLLLAAAFSIGAMTGTAGAAGSFMKTGSRTTQPVGHYELCRKLPQECRQKTARHAPIELTRGLWSSIVSINNAVNAAVAPKTDMEIWGREEVWSYPAGEGDCEDYALEKRRQLMALGMPAGDLLITVVRQPNGDGHAVLTVRTSLGDYVLDNLEPRVLAWEETPYTYLKRQSDTNSGAWVKINDGRAEAVASVR